MSRVGKLPVVIPDGVEVRVDGSTVSVKGPRGDLEQRFDPDMLIEVADGQLVVRRPTDQARHRALHGLTRSLIANMIQGVTEGFRRSLEIQGVGYRGEKRGRNLVLNVGFSHPVEFAVPEGIEIELESPTLVHVNGADKQAVGEVAAEIRQVRPPEPYKGKGIRYVGEQVRRKAGKAAVGGAL
ncbi:MAG: 50S ribosomal protein L6 [Candidatus Palauibacterales bacterium]|nr:50S ribosomal protein L6 [Candidatus Palauibacterales bacterium]MDP2529892.1 50S ribosomal protein L6 [Candidatus Palauibacterales bacterium]MDP2584750.1 50S ribosomal protein L6 [Candidatus Palauibacterales bacterium]